MVQPVGKNRTTEYNAEADARHRTRLDHHTTAAASSRKGLPNYVLAVILFVVIVLILAALMIVFQIFAAQKPQEDQDQKRTILYNGREYQYDESRTNILFMGIDKDLPMDVKRETMGDEKQLCVYFE